MAQEEERDLKQSFPRELLDQPPSERLSYFKAYTVAHPFLERAGEKVRNTLREPGGALLIFIVGPTGVGKTTLTTKWREEPSCRSLMRGWAGMYHLV
jgi:flagellar biosynthesis GTPase FlhF